MKIRLRDGSGSRDYNFVWEDTDRNGNVRLYFKRTGTKKVRLRQRPGTPEFDVEYQLVANGEPVPMVTRTMAPPPHPIRPPGGTGTLRWLCQQYFASPAFQDLDPSTRRVRRRILEAICETQDEEGRLTAGDQLFALMPPSFVARVRDRKKDTPEAANSHLKALRQLFNWACLPEYGYATRNPARDIPFLKSHNPDGHRIWSEADVAKFEKRHPIGTKARLALDLFLYTGVRISDVVKLGPQMERETAAGKALVFSETKGRRKSVKTHELPILPPLRASIDATPTGHLVYLVTEFGKPYAVKGFGNWFGRRCREAGLEPGLSAHGLRKLGAVRCVEAGATEHQLMALFGWTTTKQAALYTRKVNRVRLEAGAAPLLARNSIAPGLSPRSFAMGCPERSLS